MRNGPDIAGVARLVADPARAAMLCALMDGRALTAGELARDTQVGALILTHLSRRYYEREVLEEAMGVFPRTFVARDFDLFRVAKGGDVEHVRSPG